MGQLERIVALGQHDLFEDGLVGRPDLCKGCRLLRVKHPLDLLDELVHRVERSPVLERLYGIEEPQVQDVRVGAVGRLVEEPDVPPVGSTRGHNVRVVGDVVSRSIVLLHPDVSVPTRPQALDGREHVVQHLLLVNGLSHLHHPCFHRFHRARSPVPAVPLGCHPPREREDADFPVEVPVVDRVSARSTDGCQEHHLFDVRFMLDFAHGCFFTITKVIPLPVLLDEEPLFVHHDDVVHGVEFAGTTMPRAYKRKRPAQPPLFASLGEERLEESRRRTQAKLLEVLLEPLLREADLVCKSPLGGAVFQRHGLKDLEYLLRVDAFAARILEPPVAEVDVDTVSLLLLVARPHAQDLVPGACKLCGRVVHVVLAEFAIIAALE